MMDIISPLLGGHKHGIRNGVKPESTIIEFFYRQSEKLKKLSGYQSGKHFLPKYYSKSLEDFVRNIALNDIEMSMRQISDKLRIILNLGVNDFQYDVNSSDGGLFETPGLTFEIQCRPDTNNINEVIYTYRLTVSIPQLNQVQNIFQAFPFQFTYASVNLSTAITLKDFIKQLEDYTKSNISDIAYYYDPAIQFLEVTTKSSGKKIVVYCDHFEIFFSEDYSVYDFLTNFAL